jgi:hypothetical protein
MKELTGVGTYPIGNGAAHTGDHGDAATVSEANHLLGNGLGGHEHAGDVDLEHGVAVLGRVLQSRGLLLDTGGGDKTVHAALGVGDVLDDAVQELSVANIDAAVVQLGAQLLGALLDLCKFGGRLFETVESVDLCAGFQQGFRLG